MSVGGPTKSSVDMYKLVECLKWTIENKVLPQKIINSSLQGTVIVKIVKFFMISIPDDKHYQDPFRTKLCAF